MSEAKKYDRSYKEQSVKLALEIGVKPLSSDAYGLRGTCLHLFRHIAQFDEKSDCAIARQ